MSLRQWYRIVVDKGKKKADPETEETEAAAADPADPEEGEPDPEKEKPAPPAEEDEDEEPETEDAADIYVFDEIGKSFWNDNAVNARQFIDEVSALPEGVKTLRLHINSPGGDVAEAIAIANMLRSQRTEKGRTVDVSIEGVAASAATIISSAGSPIRIADNAMMMIHDPWSLALGNAAEMRKTADVLDQFRDAIVATYKWVSKKTPKQLAALMAAETWMNAQEAVENGLATEISQGTKAAASFRPDIMSSLKVPERFKAQFEAFLRKPDQPAQPAPAPPAPTAASAAEVLRLCREADCLDQAESILDSKVTADQARDLIAARREQRSRDAARERDIRAVCGTAKLADLADGYVAGAMDVPAVKAHLTLITAKLDKVEIDAGIRPDHETRRQAIDVSAIYAERNKRS